MLGKLKTRALSCSQFARKNYVPCFTDAYHVRYILEGNNLDKEAFEIKRSPVKRRWVPLGALKGVLTQITLPLPWNTILWCLHTKNRIDCRSVMISTRHNEHSLLKNELCSSIVFKIAHVLINDINLIALNIDREHGNHHVICVIGSSGIQHLMMLVFRYFVEH